MKPPCQSVCTVCAVLGQCASLLWSFSNMLVWLCVCAVVLPVSFWFVSCCCGQGGGCFCFLFGVWGGGVEPPVTIGCRGSGKLEV